MWPKRRASVTAREGAPPRSGGSAELPARDTPTPAPFNPIMTLSPPSQWGPAGNRIRRPGAPRSRCPAQCASQSSWSTGESLGGGAVPSRQRWFRRAPRLVRRRPCHFPIGCASGVAVAAPLSSMRSRRRGGWMAARSFPPEGARQRGRRDAPALPPVRASRRAAADRQNCPPATPQPVPVQSIMTPSPPSQWGSVGNRIRRPGAPSSRCSARRASHSGRTCGGISRWRCCAVSTAVR